MMLYLDFMEMKNKKLIFPKSTNFVIDIEPDTIKLLWGKEKMKFIIRNVPDTVYTNTDTPPSFIGGKKTFKKYFSKHLKYPDVEKNAKIKGKVIVQYIVSKNGFIKNLSIKESSGNTNLDNAALGLMGKMIEGQVLEYDQNLRNYKFIEGQLWNPATIKGKPVTTIMTMLIAF